MLTSGWSRMFVEGIIKIDSRILVGLRWWVEIDDEGVERWVFETRLVKMNTVVQRIHNRIFWFVQLFMLIVFTGMLIVNIFILQFDTVNSSYSRRLYLWLYLHYWQGSTYGLSICAIRLKILEWENTCWWFRVDKINNHSNFHLKLIDIHLLLYISYNWFKIYACSLYSWNFERCFRS